MLREEGGQREAEELMAIYIGADEPRRDSQIKTEKTSLRCGECHVTRNLRENTDEQKWRPWSLQLREPWTRGSAGVKKGGARGNDDACPREAKRFPDPPRGVNKRWCCKLAPGLHGSLEAYRLS